MWSRKKVAVTDTSKELLKQTFTECNKAMNASAATRGMFFMTKDLPIQFYQFLCCYTILKFLMLLSTMVVTTSFLASATLS